MLRILIKYPIFCQFNNKRQRRIFKIGITYSFLGVIYLHREAYRRNIRIGTEELAHLEIVGTLVRQLAKNASDKEIAASPLGAYFMNHGRSVYPADATGVPFDAMAIASTGDPIGDLTEDLAAEQKARVVYDNILKVSDDPDVNDVIKFLRQREIVHFQRFGEALDQIQNRPATKMYCGVEK